MPDDETAADGGEKEDNTSAGTETEGGGQAVGVPNRGEHEGHSFQPTGGPAMRHWQEAYISREGLDDRGNIFFAAIEMTRMSMAVADPNKPDNPIVFANKAFLDLCGYEHDEVIGRNCRFLQGPATDPAAVRQMREAIAAQRAVSVELLNYKKDGTPFWNALFIGPVFDKQEKLLYWFSSQLDVTPRRASEEALRQAQKMDAVGQLAAGLGHDLNNLLTVIIGNAEIAANRAARVGGDAALKSALDGISQAAQRAERMTHQLLAFARKQRLEPTPVDLNTLVFEFRDLMASTLGGNVDFHLDLTPRLPVCTLDRAQLEMVLLNVLINARDAMPNGGRVTVATEVRRLDGDAPAQRLPPGDHVVLSVKDEGEGMPADVLKRATEPFFTTKERGKGTGLGLAMAHGFAQQSGGALEIISEPGAGTTVRLVFPATADRVQAPAPESDDPAGARTILVVEDADDVRVVAEAHLTELGYRVLAARSAEEALGLLERDPAAAIDLLFTTFAMPGAMSGPALAEKVQERLPGTPVLLTTPYVDDVVAEGSGAAGMDVLRKPYRRAELAARVRAALNRKPEDG
jgi:PAS domain S-box-containing protein